MKLKVCGMKDVDNLKAVAEFQPDYFGFIFYEKSPRAFTLQNLPELQNIKRVGVFVNAEIDFIVNKQEQLAINVIQLHGDESKAYISDLKAKLPAEIQFFKALSMATAKDFDMTERYDDLIDAFVLDTKTPLKGGSGQKFNWQLLEHYNAERPFLLSGGIAPEDAHRIKDIYQRHPKMIGVDINSRFEINPGLKSVEDINTFITTLNS